MIFQHHHTNPPLLISEPDDISIPKVYIKATTQGARNKILPGLVALIKPSDLDACCNINSHTCFYQDSLDQCPMLINSEHGARPNTANHSTLQLQLITNFMVWFSAYPCGTSTLGKVS